MARSSSYSWDNVKLFDGAAVELGNIPVEQQDIITGAPTAETAFFGATVALAGGSSSTAVLPRAAIRARNPNNKPNAGTVVDQGHPLANALVGFWPFNEGGGADARDANRLSPPLSFTSATWAPGGGISFNGSSAYLSGTDSSALRLPTAAVTLIVAARINSNPGDGAVYAGKLEGFSNTSYGIRNQIWNTFTDVQARLNIAGTLQNTPNGAISLSLSVPYILVARWESGKEIELFVFDRRTRTLTASTISASTFSGTISYDTRPFTVGRHIANDGSQLGYIDGDIDYTLVAARRWSDGEIRRFIGAPYELLDPKPLPTLAHAAAGGGDQDIATASPTASTSFFNATVTQAGGAQTIVTAAPTASTNFFNATVTPGAVNIATASPASSASFFNATVSSTANITTAAPTAATSFFNATVSATATIVTGAPSSSVSFFGGVVSLAGAPQTITTAAPTSSTSFFNATVTATNSVVTASPTAATSFFNATISATANIVPGAPSAGTSFFNAVVTLASGPQNISTASPTSGTTFPSATVTASNTITTGAPVSGATVYNPAASATATIVTGAPSASASFFNAVVALASGPQSIIAAAPTSGTTFPGATVTATRNITTAAPSSSTSFFNATVTNAATIATGSPVSGAVFYSATVTPGAVNVGTAAPASSTNIRSHTVTTSNFINTGTVASGGTFPGVTVTPGAVGVITSLPVSGTSFFLGNLDGGGLVVTFTETWIVGKAERLDYTVPSSQSLGWTAPRNKAHWTVRRNS